MRKWIALAAFGLALAACGGDDEMSVAEWAAQVCAISNEVQAGVGSDGIDPNTLAFEERRDRAVRLTAEEIEARSRAITALDAISPPADARDFHEALTRQYRALVKIWREQEPNLATVASVTDIEVMNAEVNMLLEEMTPALNKSYQNLTAATHAALRGITRCALVG